MIIRYLTDKDVKEHDKVSSQAFVYECDINDKNSVLPCSKMLGAFDGDDSTLFSDFEIYDRYCYFGSNRLKCAAIGGVAAKPEHRGKGAVKALFDYVCNRPEYDISILYPFSDGYYRHLGYGSVGKSISLTVPFADLTDISRINDCVLFDGTQNERILKIYNNCAKQYNLCFLREDTKQFSSEPYLTQSYTYMYNENAYATFSINRAESIVNVKELFFDSPDSLKHILGFLRNFEGNQQFLRFENLPSDSPVLFYLKETKNCEIKMKNTGAVRIINFKNVFKLADYKNKSGEFTVQICNKIYNVIFGTDGVTVNTESDKEPQIITDIPTASKIITEGIRNVRDAEYLPNLTVTDEKSVFFDIFTQKTTFFTDSF